MGKIFGGAEGGRGGGLCYVPDSRHLGFSSAFCAKTRLWAIALRWGFFYYWRAVKKIKMELRKGGGREKRRKKTKPPENVSVDTANVGAFNFWWDYLLHDCETRAQRNVLMALSHVLLPSIIASFHAICEERLGRGESWRARRHARWTQPRWNNSEKWGPCWHLRGYCWRKRLLIISFFILFFFVSPDSKQRFFFLQIISMD